MHSPEQAAMTQSPEGKTSATAALSEQVNRLLEDKFTIKPIGPGTFLPDLSIEDDTANDGKGKSAWSSEGQGLFEDPTKVPNQDGGKKVDLDGGKKTGLDGGSKLTPDGGKIVNLDGGPKADFDLGNQDINGGEMPRDGKSAMEEHSNQKKKFEVKPIGRADEPSDEIEHDGPVKPREGKLPITGDEVSPNQPDKKPGKAVDVESNIIQKMNALEAEAKKLGKPLDKETYMALLKQLKSGSSGVGTDRSR